MAHKSVKISPEHHQKLKVQAAELGVPLQEYLDLILDLALSEKPVMSHLRDEYIQNELSLED